MKIRGGEQLAYVDVCKYTYVCVYVCVYICLCLGGGGTYACMCSSVYMCVHVRLSVCMW